MELETSTVDDLGRRTIRRTARLRRRQALDRLTSMTKDRRAVALVLVLVLVIGGLLAVRSFGGGSESERAQDALTEGLEAHAAGDLAGAEEAYRRAIQLDPQNEFAYYNLGVIAQASGDLAGAESNYRAAIRFAPDFVEALFNLAILRADAGAEEEAIGLYERIVDVRPDYAAAHLNLGFLLIETGMESRGEAELDEAVRLDPSLEERIAPQDSPDETS